MENWKYLPSTKFLEGKIVRQTKVFYPDYNYTFCPMLVKFSFFPCTNKRTANFLCRIVRGFRHIKWSLEGLAWYLRRSCMQSRYLEDIVPICIQVFVGPSGIPAPQTTFRSDKFVLILSQLWSLSHHKYELRDPTFSSFLITFAAFVTLFSDNSIYKENFPEQILSAASNSRRQ